MASQKIRIITDSVADIPDSLVKKWNIGIVPIFVNIGGKSFADDGVELNRAEFSRDVLTYKPPPTTAAAPPIYSERVMRESLESADHVIAVVTPAKYSGIYNAFRLAAETVGKDRITLIDSGQISLGIGFQALIGAEIAAQTGSLKDTVTAIERVRDNTVIFAAAATLDQLRRSGRVGWAAANIGALLQIKPVIAVQNGTIDAIDRVRTFKRALDRIAELAHEQAPFDRAALLDLQNEADRSELERRVSDILPENTLREPAGVALSVHMGPGAVGIVGVKQAWK